MLWPMPGFIVTLVSFDESNTISGSPNTSSSIGGGVLPLEERMTSRKGRHQQKESKALLKKVSRRKKATIKKTLSKEKAKEVVTQENSGHNNCQFRESYPSYTG